MAGRYQDMMGNLHHRQAHNPNSPYYDPDSVSASGKHVIWPEDFNGL
ncbi:hypothetical protein [Streptomyces californicus]